MRRYLDSLSRPGLAACVLLSLLAVGLLVPGESELIEISEPRRPSVPVSDQVTVATVDPATTHPPASSTSGPPSAGPVATVTAPSLVARGGQVAVGPPPTPPTVPTSTTPLLVAGDCESWRSTVERYGMPWDWARPVMWRESNCSHALADRPSTADLSVGAFQVNFYSRSMAAWWTENGWPFDLLLDDPEAAVAAAGALYAACGSGPWSRADGYPCRGDGRLRTPAEMGYGS